MKRTAIIRPGNAQDVQRACEILQAACIKVPHEVVIQPANKRRTDRQLRTLWMWHTQIAPHLTLLGNGVIWTAELVHEALFKKFFMPTREIVLPGGKVVTVSMGTSDRPPEGDNRTTKQIVSEAMDRYRAWIAQHEWEVTDPEDARW